MVELAMSTRLSFIIVANLVFMFFFHFDALTEVGAFMRAEFLCISVLRVTSGPRVKLATQGEVGRL